MSKAGKIWGETEEIFNNGIVSVNHLKIKKGGFCSEHYHKKKSNMFFIINGNLAIKIWKDDGITDETVIWPGESTTVNPGIYHQFRALTDVECLEIYEVELKDEDIFRRTHGGMKGK
ncbi:MAG: cupin domain-containing protein [Candidatus Helarchaeota archaeon]